MNVWWRSILAALAGLALVLASSPAGAGQAGSVFIRGNQLIDGNGNPLRLLGIDRSGTEYECLSGGAIFDGPVDASAIAAIASWGSNVVRVPLNEDCWLGINLKRGNKDQGAAYRNAIVHFVNALNGAGLYVILDLHLNAPGSKVARSLQPMADLDHTPAFWSSVAATFKHNRAVVFDLFNEPHDISWRCWRDGCQVTTNLGTWQTAGMTALVAAVRKAGATQPLMLGGLAYSSDLSQWLAFRPRDPLTHSPGNPVPGQPQLVASYHTYCGPPGTSTVAACQAQLAATEAQWPAVVTVSRKAPVVTGEFGEYDCATTYVEPYMAFADMHQLSFLGWAWDTYDCGQFPSLISDYNGTPTPYGQGLHDRLTMNAGR
jgi:hypothetical protein